MKNNSFDIHKFYEDLAADICEDYKNISKEIAMKIISKADVDSHAYGYEAVEDSAYELACWVSDLLKLKN